MDSEPRFGPDNGVAGVGLEGKGAPRRMVAGAERALAQAGGAIQLAGKRDLNQKGRVSRASETQRGAKVKGSPLSR
jgi:hypothetical protein